MRASIRHLEQQDEHNSNCAVLPLKSSHHNKDLKIIKTCGM